MLEIQYFTKIITLIFEAEIDWKNAFTFLCGMTSKFLVSKRREENELKVILRHRKNDVVCHSNLFNRIEKRNSWSEDRISLDRKSCFTRVEVCNPT